MKWLLGVTFIGMVLVGVLLAGVAFGQRRLIYFPDYTRDDARVPATFTLQRPGGVTLRGWVDRADQPRALIYFGGNAETLQPARATLADCCASWSGYFVPYRGYGGSDGQPARDAILADALALFDAVSKRHPGQPVAVIGRSLGSGVAAHVARQRAPAKLVLVTPFDSLGNVGKAHYPWLPVDLLLRERYDSADWLRGRATDTLVLRARDDRVVPAANTDALLRALPPTTRVVTIEGDHDSLSAQPDYVRALADFLR